MTSSNLPSQPEKSSIGKTNYPKSSFAGIKKLSNNLMLTALTTVGLAGTMPTLETQAKEADIAAEAEETILQKSQSQNIEEIQTQLFQALQSEKERAPDLSRGFLELIGSLRNDKTLKLYTDEFIAQLDKTLHIKDMPAHTAFLQRELYSKLIIERDYELEKSSDSEKHRVYILTTDTPMTFIALVNNKEILINSSRYTDIAGDLGDSLTDKIEFTGVRLDK